jgi:hypothetical protein
MPVADSEQWSVSRIRSSGAEASQKCGIEIETKLKSQKLMEAGLQRLEIGDSHVAKG